MLKGIPVDRTPRRITMSPLPSVPQRFDDCKFIEYWFTDGCFSKATIGGHEDGQFGTSWTLLYLLLRWRDNNKLGLPAGEDRLSIQIDEVQLRAIGLTSYLRSHLGIYEGNSGLRGALALLQASEKASDAIIDELAAGIRAAYERQQVWLATIAAEREGREFSWVPENKALDPRTLPAPQVVWRQE